MPAYQGEITFKQKDGSTFKGHLHGDEYFSWIKDTQGHIVVFNNKSKNYELAKLQTTNKHLQLLPTGVKALDANQTNISSVKKLINQIKMEDLKKIWKEKRNSRLYHH